MYRSERYSYNNASQDNINDITFTVPLLLLVEIDIKVVTVTDSAVEFSLNCTGNGSSNIENATLRVFTADEFEPQFQTLTFPCPDVLWFTNLIPNTTFNVSLEWSLKHLKGVSCFVGGFATMKGDIATTRFCTLNLHTYTGRFTLSTKCE